MTPEERTFALMAKTCKNGSHDAHGDWACAECGRYAHDLILDAIRAAVAEEREACAKDICRLCREGDPLEHGTPPGERSAIVTWFHQNPRGESAVETSWDLCRAAAIRIRSRQ